MTDATKTILCGSCGHENPPAAEICAACGASLAAYRSVSTAVPEARQPAAALRPVSAVPSSPSGTIAPADPTPDVSRPASPIGDALARIKERTDAEQAARPSIAATVKANEEASSVTFTPPAGQPDTPDVASPAAPMSVEATPVSTPLHTDRSRPRTSPPRPAPTSDHAPRREITAAPRRDEQRGVKPQPSLTPPRRQRPDRLARSSAATLITWGLVLVGFAFLLGVALPGASHQALGELIVTLVTLAGIILFIVGLARKSGARRPADRRPPRRR